MISDKYHSCEPVIERCSGSCEAVCLAPRDHITPQVIDLFFKVGQTSVFFKQNHAENVFVASLYGIILDLGENFAACLTGQPPIAAQEHVCKRVALFFGVCERGDIFKNRFVILLKARFVDLESPKLELFDLIHYARDDVIAILVFLVHNPVFLSKQTPSLKKTPFDCSRHERKPFGDLRNGQTLKIMQIDRLTYLFTEI